MISIQLRRQRFPLGELVVTANAQAALTPGQIAEGVQRHAGGDWGDVCSEDAGLNDEALKHGSRLLSVYGDAGKRFWVITEADRSSTTVLLPQDY